MGLILFLKLKGFIPYLNQGIVSVMENRFSLLSKIKADYFNCVEVMEGLRESEVVSKGGTEGE